MATKAKPAAAKKVAKATNIVITNKSKEVQISFYQKSEEGESNLMSVTAKVDNDSQSVLIGTALNELFHTMDEHREIGSKLFTYSSPILFSVKCEAKILDLGLANLAFQSKLKVNKTAKSKRRFAQRCVLILKSISREIVSKDVNALISELEQQIQ